LSIAIINAKYTNLDAKSSLAKGNFVKFPCKIAFFRPDAGQFAARPGVPKAAAGT
jgi:hypothetical protein